LTEIA